MKKTSISVTFTAFCILLCVISPRLWGSDNANADDAAKCLQSKIEKKRIACLNGILCDSPRLPRFYSSRRYRPAWVTDGSVNTGAFQLIAAVKEAPLYGLRQEDYHLAAIEALMDKRERPGAVLSAEDQADLDLLLTNAFFMYASHITAGRVDPETIYPEWLSNTRTVNPARSLERALAQQSVIKSLRKLHPRHPEYRKLQEALVFYRNIAARGGLEKMPAGPPLKKGSKGKRVEVLRRHLNLTGDFDPEEQDQPVFDDALESALLNYQKRHDLKADGIVGPQTTARMNVPVEVLIRTIELNLERWRWLPENLGDRHIRVNIADFNLVVIEDESPVLSMRVVVGKNYRRTPVFSGVMTHLVINPYWHVPAVIALEDMLPELLKNPRYLADQKIRVFNGWQAGSPELDPSSIEWREFDSDNLLYHLRQEPGPHNLLGRIKFMFPNRFDVYLHDTPQRYLFEKRKRNFSSGCIRLEKPIALAAYLLNEDGDWDRRTLEEAIATGETMEVPLVRPVPVHLLYFTAWVDGKGRIHFRNDIYGRDVILDWALSEDRIGQQK